METPSSMRRVTRSQASSLASHKKQEDSATSRSRTSTKAERSVLSDITNDSPIVGLAVDKTPSSALVKSRVQSKRTPGSGEALLRGQVKNLLEKVEEEAAGLAKKTSSGNRPLFLRASVGFPISPAQLLAPTPANTPQVPSFSDSKEGKGSTTATTMPTDSHEEVVEVVTMEGGGGGEAEEEVIKRTLLFDSPGKSEVSDDVSSTVTYQESLEKSSSLSSSPEDDDNSSVWSLQVNVSSSIEEGDEDEDEDEDGEVDDEPLQELCQELMKMTVSEESKRMPEFAGKHTRFIYNSDGEIEGEELVVPAEKKLVSPDVVLLKGLPVPQGKHLRFQEEGN